MDVLRPPLINVGGRFYRINNPDSDYYDTRQSGAEWDDHPSNYGNNECTQDEPCDEDEGFDIMLTDGGRYKTAFHVARIYYPHIVGSKGATKKRLEDETKTVIKVPGTREHKENEILITGSSKRSVASARRKIQLLVLSYRRKQQFTHFLSIPMVSTSVKERFMQFKQQVLDECQDQGVEESLFQKPDKLHLTLCTLVLTDDVERSEAAKVVECCKKEVVDPLMEGHSITILLSGVELMNDDPSEVYVLYAKVHANEILQDLVDDVVDYCSNAGLVDKQFEKVKLHVTIMNTKFRDAKKALSGNPKIRSTFNAGAIMEKFHDFEFGEITIDTLHLSTRHTTSKIDGYYDATTKISLLL